MTTNLSDLVYNITHPGVIEYISAFYLVIFLAVKIVLAFLVFVFAGFRVIYIRHCKSL